MTLLALIPARRGSKGILKKNLREFKGQPLIAWSIKQALNSSCIDRVVVSTEDEEIAEIARNFGAEIPFLRPNKLANDSSLVIETVLHAINNLNDVDFTNTEFYMTGTVYDIVLKDSKKVNRTNQL